MIKEELKQIHNEEGVDIFFRKYLKTKENLLNVKKSDLLFLYKTIFPMAQIPSYRNKEYIWGMLKDYYRNKDRSNTILKYN
ncbi:MAG: hypothetical protein ACRC7N_18105 [Clostridium sp.]